MHINIGGMSLSSQNDKISLATPDDEKRTFHEVGDLVGISQIWPYQQVLHSKISYPSHQGVKSWKTGTGKGQIS